MLDGKCRTASFGQAHDWLNKPYNLIGKTIGAAGTKGTAV
jgi:hypothetical protein